MYIERCAMCLDDDCELTECMQCGELFCENCHTYDGPDETPICECCLMEYEQDLEDEEEEAALDEEEEDEEEPDEDNVELAEFVILQQLDDGPKKTVALRAKMRHITKCTDAEYDAAIQNVVGDVSLRDGKWYLKS